MLGKNESAVKKWKQSDASLARHAKALFWPMQNVVHAKSSTRKTILNNHTSLLGINEVSFKMWVRAFAGLVTWQATLSQHGHIFTGGVGQGSVAGSKWILFWLLRPTFTGDYVK